MDTVTPSHGQVIISEYLRVLQRHAEEDVYPGSLRDLPYPKATIRKAFEATARALVESGQMTGELSDYLEVAYVSLADYIDDELARLMREYQAAAEALAAHTEAPRDRVRTAAWETVSAQSRLAGEIAKAVSEEAETLRREFRSWRETC
ncbi:MAG TPA: hypothetical protein VNK41_00185 [Vicinamibacterales bacterium]|nr:hypothetical protein [Vicinamibacterales bacterium]